MRCFLQTTLPVILPKLCSAYRSRSVSNQPASAVTSRSLCLAYLLKKPQLIHSPEMEKRIVQACLDAGGLEAMYCTTEFLVDGLDGETSMACMQFLSNIVRKNLEPPDAGLTH